MVSRVRGEGIVTNEMLGLNVQAYCSGRRACATQARI
jgi:hypothetical protein